MNRLRRSNKGVNMNVSVLDYGAIGDGITNDGKAIQSAIDACYKSGGGKVILPSGRTYISSSLVLKSNVEFHVETGAVLKASSNLRDFNLFNLNIDYNQELDIPSYSKCDYDGRPFLYFIYAEHGENISISGQGKIDGNEEIFYGKKSQYQIDGKFYPRMPLVYFEDIKHVSIKDVTLQRSAFWTLHLIGCKDVLIDRIRILNNLLLTNCDGIDPDHCQDVRISNSYIQCADDGIVLKNTEHYRKYGPVENVSVVNCDIVSTSGAIKFGTESVDDFKNIIVSSCNIHNTNRGITIQLRDGGKMENCIFSNLNISTRAFSKINWWGAGEPINITALKRNEKSKLSEIKHLIFNNINCDCENGILIKGEDNNISDIKFNQVYLNLSNKSKWQKNIKDFRPYYKDEFEEGKINCLYIREAKNIDTSNLFYTVDDSLSDQVEELDIK